MVNFKVKTFYGGSDGGWTIKIPAYEVQIEEIHVPQPMVNAPTLREAAQRLKLLIDEIDALLGVYKIELPSDDTKEGDFTWMMLQLAIGRMNA